MRGQVSSWTCGVFTKQLMELLRIKGLWEVALKRRERVRERRGEEGEEEGNTKRDE